jgi:osmoprotectant transport system permease protein
LAILQASSKTVDTLTGDKDKTYNYVQSEFEKRYQIKWLQPIGFNNTYALMMRQKQAAALNVKSISDLKKYLEAK